MTKHFIARSGLRVLSLTSLAAFLAFTTMGCKSSAGAATTTAAVDTGTGGDSADGNLAPATAQPTKVLGTNASYTPQQQGENYQDQQQPAPIVQGYNNQNYNNQDNNDQDYNDQSDAPAYYANQPPPQLPEYDQPPAPDPNYMWTPGYWAWGDGGYYWVPGAWVAPPYYGALWTPPYWGYYGGRYGFHRGYWGPHVGYYGGIDYGFGYIGIGFFGGYWHGNDFYYNRSVTNVGRGGHDYDREVVYDNRHYTGRPSDRVSYNGGRGGINVQPRPSELAARRESHTAPLAEQHQFEQQAAQNRQQFYSANHGRPAQFVAQHPIATNHHIAAPPAAVRQQLQHQQQGQPQQRQQQERQQAQPQQQQQRQQQLERQQAQPQQQQQRQQQLERQQAQPQQQRQQQLDRQPAQPQQQHQEARPQQQERQPVQQRPQQQVQQQEHQQQQRPQAQPQQQHQQARPQQQERQPVQQRPQARPETHPQAAPRHEQAPHPEPQKEEGRPN